MNPQKRVLFIKHAFKKNIWETPSRYFYSDPRQKEPLREKRLRLRIIRKRARSAITKLMCARRLFFKSFFKSLLLDSSNVKDLVAELRNQPVENLKVFNIKKFLKIFSRFLKRRHNLSFFLKASLKKQRIFKIGGSVLQQTWRTRNRTAAFALNQTADALKRRFLISLRSVEFYKLESSSLQTRLKESNNFLQIRSKRRFWRSKYLRKLAEKRDIISKFNKSAVEKNFFKKNPEEWRSVSLKSFFLEKFSSNFAMLGFFFKNNLSLSIRTFVNLASPRFAWRLSTIRSSAKALAHYYRGLRRSGIFKKKMVDSGIYYVLKYVRNFGLFFNSSNNSTAAAKNLEFIENVVLRSAYLESAEEFSDNFFFSQNYYPIYKKKKPKLWTDTQDMNSLSEEYQVHERLQARHTKFVSFSRNQAKAARRSFLTNKRGRIPLLFSLYDAAAAGGPQSKVGKQILKLFFNRGRRNSFLLQPNQRKKFLVNFLWKPIKKKIRGLTKNSSSRYFAFLLKQLSPKIGTSLHGLLFKKSVAEEVLGFSEFATRAKYLSLLCENLYFTLKPRYYIRRSSVGSVTSFTKRRRELTKVLKIVTATKKVWLINAKGLSEVRKFRKSVFRKAFFKKLKYRWTDRTNFGRFYLKSADSLRTQTIYKKLFNNFGYRKLLVRAPRNVFLSYFGKSFNALLKQRLRALLKNARNRRKMRFLKKKKRIFFSFFIKFFLQQKQRLLGLGHKARLRRNIASRSVGRMQKGSRGLKKKYRRLNRKRYFKFFYKKTAKLLYNSARFSFYKSETSKAALLRNRISGIDVKQVLFLRNRRDSVHEQLVVFKSINYFAEKATRAKADILRYSTAHFAKKSFFRKLSSLQNIFSDGTGVRGFLQRFRSNLSLAQGVLPSTILNFKDLFLDSENRLFCVSTNFLKNFITKLVFIKTFITIVFKSKKFFLLHKYFTITKAERFSFIVKRRVNFFLYNTLFLAARKFGTSIFSRVNNWIIKYLFFPAEHILVVKVLILTFFCSALLNYFYGFLVYLGYIFEKWRYRKHFRIMNVVKTLIWSFPYVNKLASFYIAIRGKFNMKPRARTVHILRNHLPATQTVDFYISYYYTMARNLFGAFGFHMWVYYKV